MSGDSAPSLISADDTGASKFGASKTGAVLLMKTDLIEVASLPPIVKVKSEEDEAISLTNPKFAQEKDDTLAKSHESKKEIVGKDVKTRSPEASDDSTNKDQIPNVTQKSESGGNQEGIVSSHATSAIQAKSKGLDAVLIPAFNYTNEDRSHVDIKCISSRKPTAATIDKLCKIVMSNKISLLINLSSDWVTTLKDKTSDYDLSVSEKAILNDEMGTRYRLNLNTKTKAKGKEHCLIVLSIAVWKHKKKVSQEQLKCMLSLIDKEERVNSTVWIHDNGGNGRAAALICALHIKRLAADGVFQRRYGRHMSKWSTSHQEEEARAIHASIEAYQQKFRHVGTSLSNEEIVVKYTNGLLGQVEKQDKMEDEDDDMHSAFEAKQGRALTRYEKVMKEQDQIDDARTNSMDMQWNCSRFEEAGRLLNNDYPLCKTYDANLLPGDYYNASLIPHHQSVIEKGRADKIQYIVSQAPNEETMSVFLCKLVKNRIKTYINLDDDWSSTAENCPDFLVQKLEGSIENLTRSVTNKDFLEKQCNVKIYKLRLERLSPSAERSEKLDAENIPIGTKHEVEVLQIVDWNMSNRETNLDDLVFILACIDKKRQLQDTLWLQCHRGYGRSGCLLCCLMLHDVTLSPWSSDLSSHCESASFLPNLKEDSHLSPAVLDKAAFEAAKKVMAHQRRYRPYVVHYAVRFELVVEFAKLEIIKRQSIRG